jgi:hypothetical protein
MAAVGFLSSDLNGTLVHSHTMQEMIRWAFPDEPGRWEEASKAFGRQTEGSLSMAQAFAVAGANSKGLPLRAAIMYSMTGVRYLEGYDSFMGFLNSRRLPLAIISTGYTVTLYTIRYATRSVPFKFVCNRLLFALGGEGEPLGEERLEQLVRDFVLRPELREAPLYEEIKATGEVQLGIGDEAQKAEFALHLASEMGIPPKAVAHMGDTMGDSMGILGVARAGGLGIAFNYNRALELFLRKEGALELASGRIRLVDPKGSGADLNHVIPLLS